MKTTIDISDPIFKKAQSLSREMNTTFKSLVEEGLRLVFNNHSKNRKKKIEITPFVFKGGQKSEPNWQEIQEILDQDEFARLKK